MQIGTLYVHWQGSQLATVGERLVVRNREGSILEDIPFFRLRQIVCFGSVEVTSRTIFQLMRRQIDLVYLTLKGRFKCRLSNLNERLVETRRHQYRRSFEDSFKLKVAGEIVSGKLLNYRNWVQKRQRRALVDCGMELVSINECVEMVRSAASVDELMGIEGIGSKAYFSALRKSLKQYLGFSERNRRPPRDPVNAMLSFGYTLLFNRVLAAIETAGLDPFMANLHSDQNFRPSLALDLMEEFRLFCVDNVVSRLVNLVQVKPDDFHTSEKDGVKMNEATISLLVKEMQARFAGSCFYPRDNRKIQVQDLIVRQSYLYRDAVCGDSPGYFPMLFEY